MAGIEGSCKVCNHKKVALIDQLLRAGESMVSLSKKYGISRGTLGKHKSEHIGKVLSIEGKKGLISADELLLQTTENMQFVRKMMYACDEWLKDPDDHDKYFLGARGTEVDITYLEKNDEGRYNQVPRKATLQELLDSIANDGHYMVMKLESSHSDPRELLLKAVTKLERTVEMILKLNQEQKENTFKNKAMDKLDGDKVTGISFEEEIKMIILIILYANIDFFVWAYIHMKKEPENRKKYMKEMITLTKDIIENNKTIGYVLWTVYEF